MSFVIRQSTEMNSALNPPVPRADTEEKDTKDRKDRKTSDRKSRNKKKRHSSKGLSIQPTHSGQSDFF